MTSRARARARSRVRHPPRVANPVLALLMLLALPAAAGLGFVALAPNRLLEGEPLPLWRLAGTLSAPLLAAAAACAALLLAAAFAPPARPASCAAAASRAPAASRTPRRHVVAAAAAGALLALVLALAGDAAARLVREALAPLARVSLGAGFWVLVLASVLALADALQRLRLGAAARVAASVAALLPALGVVASGALGELSLAREYANRPDVFWQAFATHLQIVAAALAPTLAIGWPLGAAAFRSQRVARPLLGALSVVQTVPALALFGLLIAPLSALGLPGVGGLPAVIALVMYSLLPVVQSTAAGLAQVSAAAIEAATAMGMTPRQVFWQVRVALALPLLVAGLRVCTVQAIGLAVLAALIGAGGLGALVFQGLFATATDLVLLGVLPVVALALVADAALRLVAAGLAPHAA